MIRSSMQRMLQRGWLVSRWHLMPALGHEIMRHRSPAQLVSRWPEGEIPLGPRVCVFVHWDGAGEVRDHVLHHLRSLAATGLSIVFVTNAGRLRPDSMAALQGICAGILIRRNVGYDFGAWREGFEQLALPRPNTTMVMMANDSVYGPLRPLDTLMATIDFTKADVWGCTDTWQSRYHLQSYMIAFSPRVVASPAWRTFWSGVRPTWAKHWLIRLYEIGLTQSLLKAGFTCRAIWPYQSLVGDLDLNLLDDRKRDDEEEKGPNPADPMVQVRRHHVHRLREAIAHRLPLNPTSDLWRQLLRAGFPFIKRELLRDNPSHVADVVEWRDVAAELADQPLAPIERDLQRTLRNRAP